MKTVLLVSMIAALSAACSTSRVRNTAPERAAPLQLWSDHKPLDLTVEVCGDKAFHVLNALGFSEVVRNGNFSYGNRDACRAAVKCVQTSQGSFVYFAVAGHDKAVVENLRNQIARKF